MRRIIAALLMVLSLAACGSDISSGTVTNKEYTAEWTQMVMQCYSYGANGTCTVQMPTYTTWPEEYTLFLRNDEGQTGHVKVSAEAFNYYEVGSNYP